MRIRAHTLIFLALSPILLITLYVLLMQQPSPPHHPHEPAKHSLVLQNHLPRQFSHEPPPLILDNTSAVLEMARTMHRENGLVLFTMINDAFLDFAASWCCNTARFSILQRVLFVTTDFQTAQHLKSLWGQVKVAVIDSPDFRGPQEYSRAGYVRLMVERTHFILNLLESGVQLLLFEVDSVWLKNPMSLIAAHQSDGDIVATRVTGKDTTAGCFLLLNPTPVTVKFWNQLTQMMDELYRKIKTYEKSVKIHESLNDQEFFSVLARKKYAGIRVVYVPAELIPDGKWYSLPKWRRERSPAYIINNNWIVGTEAKRLRAKEFGHWFWDELRKECNASALNRLG